MRTYARTYERTHVRDHHDQFVWLSSRPTPVPSCSAVYVTVTPGKNDARTHVRAAERRTRGGRVMCARSSSGGSGFQLAQGASDSSGLRIPAGAPCTPAEAGTGGGTGALFSAAPSRTRATMHVRTTYARMRQPTWLITFRELRLFTYVRTYVRTLEYVRTYAPPSPGTTAAHLGVPNDGRTLKAAGKLTGSTVTPAKTAKNATNGSRTCSRALDV